MKNVFIVEEKSNDKYKTIFGTLIEILEIVLHESNYPLCGSLIIGIQEKRSIKELFRVRMGTDDGDSQFAFEQNMCIYMDLCEDVMESLHKAVISRGEPVDEGLQRISCGNPRSLYVRIDGIPFYIVYFATYAGELTGREIERIYLAIAEILRRLFPEDEHLWKVASEIINEILPQREVTLYPDYRDTMIVVRDELAKR